MKNSIKTYAAIAFVIAFVLAGCRSTNANQSSKQVSFKSPALNAPTADLVASTSDPVQLASHVDISNQDKEKQKVADKDKVGEKDDDQDKDKLEKSEAQGVVLQAPATTITQQSDAAIDTIVRPTYAELVQLPIDLPTVIRLVDANSPAVSIAQAKVREAQARLARAEVQWLPNLTAGIAYNRFDGQTQNQGGAVFGVSRSNLFAGGGPALSLDLAEAIYRPLIERQQTSAEQLRARAVCLGSELEAVLAYLDLLQVYASLEINADTTSKAESMLTAAENAKDAKLDRTAGDVNRAKTEVLFRRIERIELVGKKGAASARLGKLLLLEPNVMLIPADTAVVPINLIDPSSTIDELVSTAIRNRPDLAAMRHVIGAAWANVKKQEEGPRLPKLAVVNQTGAFGGGLNGDLGNFDSRNVLGVQLYWEIKNLGFGNRYEIDERNAVLGQSRAQMVETQARACAEIVEVAQSAAAKYESLALAEQAIQQATELYRINKEGTLNVIDAKNLFDALRPLQAIQTLNQARQNLLNSIVEYNRSQYKLYTLVGNNIDLAPGS